MHDIVKPLRASSTDLKVMQHKTSARSQGTVRFANCQSPRVAVEMMAAIRNENTIKDVVTEQAPRGRLTDARQRVSVTGVDHEFRDVGGVNGRSVLTQRLTKSSEGSIASEYIQDPEILAGNVAGR
jgi:hypothetical protein